MNEVIIKRRKNKEKEWNEMMHCIHNMLRPLFFLIRSFLIAHWWSNLYLWPALAKAQQLLLDSQERDYVLSQVNAAKGVLWSLSTFFSTVSLFWLLQKSTAWSIYIFYAIGLLCGFSSISYMLFFPKRHKIHSFGVIAVNISLVKVKPIDLVFYIIMK